MSKPLAFWDASALVPLCVREMSSRQAHIYIGKFSPVVWWASLVEVHSAICRLHRSRELSDQQKQGALSGLRLLARGWREVLPDDSIRELAAASLDKYRLRASDSLQLAAALAWCQMRPAKRTFVCADQRLAQAAGAAGFSVLQLLAA
ncbi:MAG: type II toxin-antitoxin system VapC family toxin [Candidatus Acidiferrales bacterium]